MFNSKKPSSPRDLRLPKQRSVPSYNEIQFLMEESYKIKGRWVEQPFSLPDHGLELLLSVRVNSPQEEPSWMLSQMDGNDSTVLWNYSSRDLSLICNLLLSSSGESTLQDSSIPTDSFASGNKADTTMALNDAQTASQGQYNEVSSYTTLIFDPPRPGIKATLEGDLKNLQVPNLLQSINLAKMTGLLDVRCKVDETKIYFNDGTPYHCVSRDSKGDLALIELLIWEEGEFRFWPDETVNEKTVTRRLESVLMEGITLLDQYRYLTSQGLKLESCLIKKNAVISEEEFKSRLTKGAPIPLNPQLDFYELIDNRSSLFDLLRNRPLNKNEWIPIMFNLVSCGLIQITDQAPAQNRLAYLKSLGLDEGAVQSVLKGLTRNESGILTYPAFFYFLDQEYLRYEYFNLPFSLVLFSLGQRTSPNAPVESLPMLAVRRAMQRIGLIKRNVDIIGHYETFDYGIILPNTNSAAAMALTNRVSDVLREAPLSSNMDPRSLALAFGVASIPDDCQELDKLVNLAKASRERAKQTNQKVVLARDLGLKPTT